jgi:hypothetical protein
MHLDKATPKSSALRQHALHVQAAIFSDLKTNADATLVFARFFRFALLQ